MALPGFRKYFEKASDEHLKRSEMLMTYQNKRGGRIVLQDIETPQRDEWGTGIDAMREAQTLKERLNQSLLELHATADALGDAHMTDFIESEYLTKQVDIMKELGDHCANLKRVGPGLGLFQFDKKTLS